MAVGLILTAIFILGAINLIWNKYCTQSFKLIGIGLFLLAISFPVAISMLVLRIKDYRLVGDTNITSMHKRYVARKIFFKQIFEADNSFTLGFIQQLHRACLSNGYFSYTARINKLYYALGNNPSEVAKKIFCYLYNNGGSILFEQVLANCIGEKLSNNYEAIRNYRIHIASENWVSMAECRPYLVFDWLRIEWNNKRDSSFVKQIISAMNTNEDSASSLQMEFILQLNNGSYSRHFTNLAIIKTGGK